MKKSFNFLRFQKAIMSSLETTLYIILALYFLIKILVELLARLDRIMELLSAIFFNTSQPHNSTKHYKLISIPYIRPIGQHIAIQIGYPICTLHFFRDWTDIYDYVFPISIPNCLSDRTQWMNRDWMSDL